MMSEEVNDQSEYNNADESFDAMLHELTLEEIDEHLEELEERKTEILRLMKENEE